MFVNERQKQADCDTNELLSTIMHGDALLVFHNITILRSNNAIYNLNLVCVSATATDRYASMSTTNILVFRKFVSCSQWFSIQFVLPEYGRD